MAQKSWPVTDWPFLKEKGRGKWKTIQSQKPCWRLPWQKSTKSFLAVHGLAVHVHRLQTEQPGCKCEMRNYSLIRPGSTECADLKRNELLYTRSLLQSILKVWWSFLASQLITSEAASHRMANTDIVVGWLRPLSNPVQGCQLSRQIQGSAVSEQNAMPKDLQRDYS